MALDKSRIQGFGSNGTQAKVWQCPQGHMLQPWSAKAGACDGCCKTVQKGERVMDCRACNYYLCEACHPQEQDSLSNSLLGTLNSILDAAAQEVAELAEDMSVGMETAVSVFSCTAPEKDLANEFEVLDVARKGFGDRIQEAESLWRVVKSGVKVRKAKDVRSDIMSVKPENSLIMGSREGDWLKLPEKRGYVLIQRDGTQFLQILEKTASVVHAQPQEDGPVVNVDDSEEERDVSAEQGGAPPAPRSSAPKDLMEFEQEDLLDFNEPEKAPASVGPEEVAPHCLAQQPEPQDHQVVGQGDGGVHAMAAAPSLPVEIAAPVQASVITPLPPPQLGLAAGAQPPLIDMD